MIKSVAFGLAVLAGLTAAGPILAQTAIVEARLESAVDVSPPLKPGEVTIDAMWRQTFRIEKVLYGTFSDATVKNIEFSAERIPGHEYLLLIDKSGGKRVVVWWDTAEEGLCLESGTAKKYGIETAVASLRRDYPCTDK
jgi:hypothetical protein